MESHIHLWLFVEFHDSCLVYKYHNDPFLVAGNSGSYDVFPGTGQDEPNSAYSLSPKASFDSGNVSNHDSQSSDNGDDLDDLENSIPKRKKVGQCSVCQLSH